MRREIFARLVAKGYLPAKHPHTEVYSSGSSLPIKRLPAEGKLPLRNNDSAVSVAVRVTLQEGPRR